LPGCEIASIGPFGLGVAPDLLVPGRGDREAGGAGGGDRLQRDQVDAAAGDQPVGAGDAVGVARVTAAGDEQGMGLGAPAVAGAGADRFGDVLQRIDAGVGAPVGGALVVVVALMGRGALGGRAVGADADLDAFPVVVVVAQRADDRDAAQGGSGLISSKDWLCKRVRVSVKTLSGRKSRIPFDLAGRSAWFGSRGAFTAAF
jgi:hypothetical protein